MPTLSQIYSYCPSFLKSYLTYMSVIKGKSENTIKQYYYDLRMFLRFNLMIRNDIPKSEFDNIEIVNFDFNIIKDITLDDLYEFMAYVNNEHSSNDSFRARKVASLKSFFKYLYIKDKSIEDNPAQNLETPKLKKRMPKYLSLEQSIELIKVIDGKYKQRDLAMFLLFLTCGLRLSELVGINIKNIDFKARTLKIIGKGNKERIVFLNEICIEAIKNYLEVRPMDMLKADDKDALFISSKFSRITGRSIELIAKKYFEQAGIDTTVYTPHKLRHTAATIMYRDGNVDIRTLQELLGHASLSTTQIYTHVKNDDLRNAADKNPLSKISLKSNEDNKN